MKRNISLIVMVISCIVSAVCLAEIYSLKNELNNLRNNIDVYMLNIQTSVNNITGRVENTLEREANLLAESGWDDWKNVKLEENQVTVECFVVPKEYSPENTKAYIYCNDTAFPMTLENGKFVADVTMPVFTESSINKVQFEENDTVRTQSLDWYMNPKVDILPEFYANSGGYTISYKDDFAKFNYNGYVDLHIDHNGKSYEKRAEFAVMVDGKEVWRKGIDLVSPFHSTEYMDIYDVEISKDFDIPYGSTVEVYVEFKDGYGLIHRCTLENFTTSKNETDRNEAQAFYGTADIYASDGTPLYLREWYE